MEEYAKGGVVGHGTFSVVYRATHRPTGAPVALKKVKCRMDEGVSCSVLREAKLLRELRGASPHVVALLDVLCHKHQVLLVFEAMETDMEAVIRDHRVGLGPREVKGLALQLLRGLACIHAAGVAHRDVKPDNLLLCQQGCLKLADFGMARFMPRGRAQRLSQQQQQQLGQGQQQGQQQQHEHHHHHHHHDLQHQGQQGWGGGATGAHAGPGEEGVQAGAWQGHGGARAAAACACEAGAGGCVEEWAWLDERQGLPGTSSISSGSEGDDAGAYAGQGPGSQAAEHHALARCPSPAHVYTNQISARWYRAPELLFGATQYDGAAVDMWAAGCVLAELLLRRVWFQGATDMEQLSLVFAALGAPDEASWPGVSQLKTFVPFKRKAVPPLASGFEGAPAATPEALDLLAGLVALNPAARLTAEQALAHPYFADAPEPHALNVLQQPASHAGLPGTAPPAPPTNPRVAHHAAPATAGPSHSKRSIRGALEHAWGAHAGTCGAEHAGAAHNGGEHWGRVSFGDAGGAPAAGHGECSVGAWHGAAAAGCAWPGQAEEGVQGQQHVGWGAEGRAHAHEGREGRCGAPGCAGGAQGCCECGAQEGGAGLQQPPRTRAGARGCAVPRAPSEPMSLCTTDAPCATDAMSTCPPPSTSAPTHCPTAPTTSHLKRPRRLFETDCKPPAPPHSGAGATQPPCAAWGGCAPDTAASDPDSVRVERSAWKRRLTLLASHERPPYGGTGAAPTPVPLRLSDPPPVHATAEAPGLAGCCAGAGTGAACAAQLGACEAQAAGWAAEQQPGCAGAQARHTGGAPPLLQGPEPALPAQPQPAAAAGACTPGAWPGALQGADGAQGMAKAGTPPQWAAAQDAELHARTPPAHARTPGAPHGPTPSGVSAPMAAMRTSDACGSRGTPEAGGAGAGGAGGAFGWQPMLLDVRLRAAAAGGQGSTGSLAGACSGSGPEGGGCGGAGVQQGEAGGAACGCAAPFAPPGAQQHCQAREQPLPAHLHPALQQQQQQRQQQEGVQLRPAAKHRLHVSGTAQRSPYACPLQPLQPPHAGLPLARDCSHEVLRSIP